MSEKISNYSVSASALEVGDLLDVSKRISTGPDVFQSQKADVSLLANWNLFGQDQTLLANRSHDLNDKSFGFLNGDIGFGDSVTVLTQDSNISDSFKVISSNGNSLFHVSNTNENAGIGTNAPTTSAILEVNSNSKGFLKPRLTTTERNNIILPVEGLEIYNTTTGQSEFYNGASWSGLGGDTIFTGGTFTGNSTVDLANNTLTFEGGVFNIQGAGTSTGTTLALYDSDTTPNKTWEWLDNGNVNIGQDTVFNLGNKDLNFEGSGLTKISNGSRYVGVPDWNVHTSFDINNGTTSARFIMANASSAYNQNEFSLNVGSFQPIRVQGSTIALGGGFGKNDFNSSYRINLKGGVYGDDGDLVFTDSINELAFDFDNYPKLKIKTSSNEWWMIEGSGAGSTFASGDLYIYDSTNSRKMMQFKANGTINMPNLPTSSSGLSSGDLWNDGGTLKIV